MWELLPNLSEVSSISFHVLQLKHLKEGKKKPKTNNHPLTHLIALADILNFLPDLRVHQQARSRAGSRDLLCIYFSFFFSD